jgi:hypothetical protein
VCAPCLRLGGATAKDRGRQGRYRGEGLFVEQLFEPRSKSAILVVVVLLVGMVIGGIGFVLGRDSAEPAHAQSVVRAAASEQIVAARKAGYKNGFADGRKAGARSATRDRGGDANGPDALSAGDFDLDPGAYYIVQVAEGSSAQAAISDYAPLEPGISYELCDAYGVCRQAP